MIESVQSVTKFINQSAAEMPQVDLNGHNIIGVYLSSTANHQPDRLKLERLEKLCITLTGTAPLSCLHIDLGHQGRMDAHLFTDTTLTQVQPLEMLEENGLYPDSSNR